MFCLAKLNYSDGVLQLPGATGRKQTLRRAGFGNCSG